MMRRTSACVALASYVVASVLGAVSGSSAYAADPAPPAQPAMGQLGGPGPCSKGSTPSGFASLGQKVWLFQPTGSGTPRTGGTCNDKTRPVVFIAAGFSALIPEAYQHLIDDMVSNGYMVVYVNYTLMYAPSIVYPQVDEGFRYGAGWLNFVSGNRMDLANIGIWGHSYGAGMLPWLSNKAAARGWGSSSLWLSMNATAWLFWVPLTGPIHLPKNARVQVIAYDADTKADHRVGIDAFSAFDIAASQKDHIQIRSDKGTVADHFTPVTWDLSWLPHDHLDFYGVYRNYQALGDCARAGKHCDADLSYMGTWSDGREAIRAVVSDTPVDMGPPAALECDNTSDPARVFNPRFCVP